MSLLDTLKKRNLPPIRTRTEMLDTLQRECYGYRPTEGGYSVGEPTRPARGFANGEANYDTVPFTVKTERGEHTFSLHRVLHTDGKKRPFVVFIQFAASKFPLQFVPDMIAEEGFDILWFHYGEVTSDNGDFENGVAPLFERGCGKIALWSRVASLVLDYASTLPMLDMNGACVAGHSRLGKTALLTAALDERFKFVFTNNAGCAGDAVYRGRVGEQIADITKNFPYWFCEEYKKFIPQGYPTDWDQHWLMASVAPRYVYVGISSEDEWADPVSEQLCCAAAATASGEDWQDQFFAIGDGYATEHIGAHLRRGPHQLNYHDWLHFLRFVKERI